AGAWQALQDLQRGIGVGIARHDIGDEAGPALCLEGREARIDTGGGQIWRPRCAATVARSLSPRPERLRTMTPSLPTTRLTSSRRARAWADSRAGMMPSRRVQSCKASS